VVMEYAFSLLLCSFGVELDASPDFISLYGFLTTNFNMYYLPEDHEKMGSFFVQQKINRGCL
jgi:hypothetical protein